MTIVLSNRMAMKLQLDVGNFRRGKILGTRASAVITYVDTTSSFGLKFRIEIVGGNRVEIALRLFNIYMDGVMTEMKGKVGVKMYALGRKWVLNSILFADDTVLLIAEYESDLQNLVSVFDSVCKRRKLKVNVNKSKVMVCEQSRSEAVDFVCPYRVGIECEKDCKITLNGEEMEKVNEFKYFGSITSKHGGTEGEARERALQGRRVAGSLGRIMNGRSVSMEVKRDLRKGIARKKGGWVFRTYEWHKCEHGIKEGFEKYSNNTNPHICKQNMGLE